MDLYRWLPFHWILLTSIKMLEIRAFFGTIGQRLWKINEPNKKGKKKWKPANEQSIYVLGLLRFFSRSVDINCGTRFTRATWNEAFFAPFSFSHLNKHAIIWILSLYFGHRIVLAKNVRTCFRVSSFVRSRQFSSNIFKSHSLWNIVSMRPKDTQYFRYFHKIRAEKQNTSRA